MPTTCERTDSLDYTNTFEDNCLQYYDSSQYYNNEETVTMRVGRFSSPETRDVTTEKVESSDYPWLRNALSKLDAVEKLPFDWDSYGSPSLDKELCKISRLALKSICEPFLSTPVIVPISGGGVQIEWQHKGKELELEFSEFDKIGYLKVFEDDNMSEGEITVKDLCSEINNLINWLAS